MKFTNSRLLEEFQNLPCHEIRIQMLFLLIIKIRSVTIGIGSDHSPVIYNSQFLRIRLIQIFLIQFIILKRRFLF